LVGLSVCEQDYSKVVDEFLNEIFGRDRGLGTIKETIMIQIQILDYYFWPVCNMCYFTIVCRRLWWWA